MSNKQEPPAVREWFGADPLGSIEGPVFVVRGNGGIRLSKEVAWVNTELTLTSSAGQRFGNGCMRGSS